MGERPHVSSLACKSVLNRVDVPGLPFHWSINPYRGCSHACVYCYARQTHTYLGLDAGRDFETRIFAKEDAPSVLRRELGRPTWCREVVALGTAVDPYQPAEGRYKLTRQILEILLEQRTPCSIVTKNTMVLRDVDLLRELARTAGCQVHFSVTTTDRRLARLIEPDTPPPEARLAAMRQLVEAGVPAGVLLAPVLPGLTDAPYQIESVVRAAATHKARFLFANVLRLGPGAREVFLAFVEREFPVLVPLYRRLYVGQYPPRSYRLRIARLVARLVRKWGIPQEDLLQRAGMSVLGDTGARRGGELVGARPARRHAEPARPVQLPLSWG